MVVDVEADSSMETRRRMAIAVEFWLTVLDGVGWSGLPSDSNTLNDLASLPPEQVMSRCRRYFGVRLRLVDFHVPFWRLLDRIELERPEPEASGCGKRAGAA